MARPGRTRWIVLAALILSSMAFLVPPHQESRAMPDYEYVVLDTTREQFLGIERGAMGSTSVLTFTAASSAEGGELHLMPVGIAGEWETLASPLLPHPIEAAGAVLYAEPEAPYRRRIYLLGGYKASSPAERLDTVYTCDVQEDGSLGEWTLQTFRLPRRLSSPAAALSTVDVYGNPITPTIYVLGGKYPGGVSADIYYAHIDPATLDVGEWQTSAYGLGDQRLGLSAVVNKGYLYALGGFDGVSRYSAAVWHFPLGPAGAPIGRFVDPNLPGEPNDNANAVYHQTVLLPAVSPYLTDTLYVIGGYNSTSSTPRVLRGDIDPNWGYVQEWVDVGSDDLPNALSAFTGSLGNPQGAGRQVYIVGGDLGVDGGNPQQAVRSAVVNDGENGFYNWYGGVWLTSPVLPAPRYRHAAVIAGDYLYAIGGRGVGSDYYSNVLRGNLVGTGAGHYVPAGSFRSRVVDLGQKYRLGWLQWESTLTVTHPGISLTLQFRAGNKPDLSDAVGAWSPLYPTEHGEHALTSIAVPDLPNYPYYPPVARYVQYRAFFSTTEALSDITPILYEVGVLAESAPDLFVPSLRITCEDCVGTFAPISQTVTVHLTVKNQGGAVPPGNNFFTMLFITTTGGYLPTPPDLPTDRSRFLPGSTYWGHQGAQFVPGASVLLTTTIFFTQPLSLYLYAYADYNDTSEPPDYVVGELDYDNNLTVLNILILRPEMIPHLVFLPLISMRAQLGPPLSPGGAPGGAGPSP